MPHQVRHNLECEKCHHFKKNLYLTLIHREVFQSKNISTEIEVKRLLCDKCKRELNGNKTDNNKADSNTR